MWIGGIDASGTIITATFAVLTWRQGAQRRPKDSTVSRPLNLGWFIAFAILFTGLLACIGAGLYIWIRETHPLTLLVAVVALVILLVLTWLGVGRSFASNPSPPVGNSVQWKPAWQKLQWCNDERQRLEGEVNKWKGLYESASSKRSDESATHFVFVNIISFRVDEQMVARGKTLKIRYEVNSSEDVSDDIWLGASLRDKNGKHFSNVRQDKPVSLLKGTHEYDRDLTIPADALLGNHMLGASVWHGVLGDSNNSVAIAKGGRVEIAVVAY